MGELGAFLKIHRVGFDKRDPGQRVNDYKQYFGLQPEEELKRQGARCMDCGIPFCHEGCPLGNLIPDWNDLVYRGKWREAIDQLQVAATFEPSVHVVHVGDPAAHPGGEVPARAAEHHDPAPGHVLATVIADAFDNRARAGVAHREALAGETPEERPARGRAVQHGVADDHVLLGAEAVLLGRADRHHAS